MQILVTGAAGRVGTEVLLQLQQKQELQLVGFDEQSPSLPIEGVRYIRGSLHNINELRVALKNVDLVVHLAAQMSWKRQDNAAMYRTNLNGTFNLLETVASQGLERFVFASTGEVYPEVLPQYLPITEEHPLEPTSLYGETKKLGEELVRFYQQRFNIPAVILRLPHTQRANELLDPNSFFSGPRFFLQSKIKQMRSFENFELVELLERYNKGKLAHILQCDETGQPYQMHISDVRDTAAGIVLGTLHKDAIGQIFNITTDIPLLFSDILVQMQEITRCEIISIAMPGAPIRYATSNKKIKELLGYQPQYPFAKMLEEAAKTWDKQEDG